MVISAYPCRLYGNQFSKSSLDSLKEEDRLETDFSLEESTDDILGGIFGGINLSRSLNIKRVW